MSNKTYSTTERLSSQARGRLANVSGGGILSGVVFLSGVLSALFFWQNSQLVFTNVWPPAALALGLVVGLLPSEGAFFGWKAVRASKTDMTSSQVKATKWGLVTAVITSAFSTFALFVASFPSVPAEIRAYSDWFVFLALSLPVILQTAIYANFAVNERGVVENQKRAELSALGFDSWIRAEQARMQSIINGIDAALDKQLEAYGEKIGAQEAGQMLEGGGQQLLEMGQQGGVNRPTDPQTYTVLFDTENGPWNYTVVGSLKDAKSSAAKTISDYNVKNVVIRHDGTGAIAWEGPKTQPQTAVSQGNGVNPTQRYNQAQGD